MAGCGGRGVTLFFDKVESCVDDEVEAELVVRAEGADVERVVVLAQHGRAHNHHAEHREPAESAEAQQSGLRTRDDTPLFMATLHRGVT